MIDGRTVVLSCLQCMRSKGPRYYTLLLHATLDVTTGTVNPSPKTERATTAGVIPRGFHLPT